MYGFKILSIHKCITLLYIHALPWHVYPISPGYVMNSLLSIQAFGAPLKTSNGVSTRSLAETVMAHVTLFVSHVVVFQM